MHCGLGHYNREFTESTVKRWSILICPTGCRATMYAIATRIGKATSGSSPPRESTFFMIYQLSRSPHVKGWARKKWNLSSLLAMAQSGSVVPCLWMRFAPVACLRFERGGACRAVRLEPSSKIMPDNFGSELIKPCRFTRREALGKSLALTEVRSERFIQSRRIKKTIFGLRSFTNLPGGSCAFVISRSRKSFRRPNYRPLARLWPISKVIYGWHLSVETWLV